MADAKTISITELQGLLSSLASQIRALDPGGHAFAVAQAAAIVEEAALSPHGTPDSWLIGATLRSLGDQGVDLSALRPCPSCEDGRVPCALCGGEGSVSVRLYYHFRINPDDALVTAITERGSSSPGVVRVYDFPVPHVVLNE